MSQVKLLEKRTIQPKIQTTRRRIFLSNIDLSLRTYQESVLFFTPPPDGLTFMEACQSLYHGVSEIQVAYDFLGGRLVMDEEGSGRLEIDCNGAGITVASATLDYELDKLGDLMSPKQEFMQLVSCLHDDIKDEIPIEKKPLMLLQLTQFKCGSIAFASCYNHCTMDGITAHGFEINLAALTKHGKIIAVPNPNRMMLKARNPPVTDYPHYEYSKSVRKDDTFTTGGMGTTTSVTYSIGDNHCLVHFPPQLIGKWKKTAIADGTVKNCSTFQVIAAKIWKARTSLLGLSNEEVSTMLFPVDVRKRLVPNLPKDFAGNAIIPGYARATVSDIMGETDSFRVKKVQEGVERLDDKYVRSAIDWLEENKGTPCGENSFSLVAWVKLGLDDGEYAWGRAICATTISVKSGLVILLPGPDGAMSVCLDMPLDRGMKFKKLMMED